LKPDDVAKAEAGDFDAMLRVGLACLSDADEKNNVAGVKWLEMSSAGGSVAAYYNLGVLYQDGKLVRQDGSKALMYHTLAAELGEPRAMNRLAGMYFTGELVPANDILAVKWALCALSLGNETAKKNVERMRSEVSERDVALGAKAAVAWGKARKIPIAIEIE
jgi:TPR repeat protein